MKFFKKNVVGNVNLRLYQRHFSIIWGHRGFLIVTDLTVIKTGHSTLFDLSSHDFITYPFLVEKKKSRNQPSSTEDHMPGLSDSGVPLCYSEWCFQHCLQTASRCSAPSVAGIIFLQCWSHHHIHFTVLVNSYSWMFPNISSILGASQHVLMGAGIAHRLPLTEAIFLSW